MVEIGWFVYGVLKLIRFTSRKDMPSLADSLWDDDVFNLIAYPDTQ